MTNVLIPKAIQDVLNTEQLETIQDYLNDHPDYIESLVSATQLFQGDELRERIVRGVVVPIRAQQLRSTFQNRIAQGGWMVQGVLGDETQPPFAYTMGLSQYGGTELFVSGVPPEVAQSILNDLGEQIKANPELTVEDLERPLIRIQDSWGGRVRFHRIPLLPTLDEYTRPLQNYIDVTPDLTLLVVVLPDANNVLPGEDGYDETFRQILFNDDGSCQWVS